MAKPNTAVLVAAVCLLALAGAASGHDYLYVTGKVYCDTCNTRFVTRLSEYIEGATVRVECHNRTTGLIAYSLDGKTDATGTYKIPVEGNHETDICEVTLIRSPREDCNEVDDERSRARILLTKNNGIVSEERMANALGFFSDDVLPGCAAVLQELGLAA